MSQKRWELSDLVGVQDIAQHFEVGSSTVSNWQARYKDFPEPLCCIGMRNVYSLRQIKEWYKRKFVDKTPRDRAVWY